MIVNAAVGRDADVLGNQVGLGRAWPLAETDPIGEPGGDTLQVLGDALHQGRSRVRGPVG